LEFELSIFAIRRAKAREQSFITKVYGWMALALLTTGAVAVLVPTDFTMFLATNESHFIALLIGEYAIVGVASLNIESISPRAAMAAFFTYAVLNGLLMSTIFRALTYITIVSAFAVSAGMFALSSLYGHMTKKDLTKPGSLCVVGLIGVILASLENLFLYDELFYDYYTYVGVLIFIYLIAADMQKIKLIYAAKVKRGDDAAAASASIIGALLLYLDFLGLFMKLVRILSKRRGKRRR
jgi:FtsH-binding integral membrane protein